MKNILKVIAVILIAGAVAGFIYWQIHKKNIVRDSIENTIGKKTDSLYFVHYDSSDINELTASASFYNVVLQSDSVQEKILERTDNLPNVLYHIRVAEVTAKGVDVPGLLQKRNVAATSITLIKPVVQVINTGVDKPKPFTYNDTLQLYEKILGKFSSIRADTISIMNGTVMITNKTGKALTTIENINISLHNFLIDSTKNYQNIISYFIKDVNVSVTNIQLPETEKNTRINIGKLVYDAPGKKLEIGEIQQYKTGNSTAIVDLKNIVLGNLNTDLFISKRQLKAGLVSCDGGIITIDKKKKASKDSTEKTIEFSSDLIDAAQIEAVQLGSTTIIVRDPADASADPFVINDVKCKASNIKPVSSGSTLSSLIYDATWEISAGGFSFLTKEKLYRFAASGLNVNSSGLVEAKQISVKPQLTEEEFSRVINLQKDRYDIQFNNFKVEGLDLKMLFSKNILEAAMVTLQPILKIYNDRTRPPDMSVVSKNFPHQDLLKLPLKMYIKKIVIQNGSVYYKEKAEKSAMTGTPNFTSINGTVDNVTNIPGKIALNNKLTVKASSLFLGSGRIKTEWVLPLNSDTAFTVTGELGPMNGSAVNSITKPLGMLAVKEGKINSLVFSMRGSTHLGTGNVTFLYNDLIVEALKMKEDELKKKGLATFLANTLIINDNPKNDKIREGEIYYERDVKRSFFNLIWKSIFSGVKKAAISK